MQVALMLRGPVRESGESTTEEAECLTCRYSDDQLICIRLDLSLLVVSMICRIIKQYSYACWGTYSLGSNQRLETPRLDRLAT
jgi:hypothetical protein